MIYIFDNCLLFTTTDHSIICPNGVISCHVRFINIKKLILNAYAFYFHNSYQTITSWSKPQLQILAASQFYLLYFSIKDNMQNFFWWYKAITILNAIAINRQKLKLRAKEFNFFAIDQEKIGSNFVIWKMPWKKAEVWLFVYICVCKCKITFFFFKESFLNLLRDEQFQWN